MRMVTSIPARHLSNWHVLNAADIGSRQTLSRTTFSSTMDQIVMIFDSPTFS
jgi:hypothetical protein